MALSKANKGKYHTLDNTVPYYCFSGIIGTGGIKTAGLGKKRRNKLLIDPDYKEHDALEHVGVPISLKAFVISRRTSE